MYGLVSHPEWKVVKVGSPLLANIQQTARTGANQTMEWSKLAADVEVAKANLSASTTAVMALVYSARACMVWGHAPRVRSAAAFRRGLASVVDRPIDAG